MATHLWLVDTSANSGDGPSAEQSTPLPNGSVSSPTFAKRDLSTTQGTGAIATVTHTHPADTTHRDGMLRMFVSDALAAGTINSDTWTFFFWGIESNAAADTFFNVALYVWRPGTGTKVGTIYDSHDGVTGVGGELPTSIVGSASARTFQKTGAAVTVQAGDRIVLEVWHHWQHTMATAYTSDLRYNVDPSGTGADPSFIHTPQSGLFGGGTPHSVSPADGFALTDAPTLTQGKRVADSLALTDTRAFTLGENVADGFGLTDARAHSQGKQLTETFGLTDAAVPGYRRDVDDGLTLTDAQWLAQTRTLTDALGLTDARSFAQTRTFADGLAFTDATAFAQGRRIGDGLALTDNAATSAAGSHSRTIGDAFGFSDALARSSGIFRTQADGLLLTDALTRQLQLVRAQADALAFTDTQALIQQIHRTFADGFTLTDLLVVSGGIVPGHVTITDTSPSAEAGIASTDANTLAVIDLTPSAGVTITDTAETAVSIADSFP